jgi:hypothetical protein
MAFDPTGNGSVTLRVCFAKSTLVVKLQTEFVDLEFNGAPALRCGSCGGASAVDDGGGSSAGWRFSHRVGICHPHRCCSPYLPYPPFYVPGRAVPTYPPLAVSVGSAVYKMKRHTTADFSSLD